MIVHAAAATSPSTLLFVDPPAGALKALDESIRSELQRNSHAFFLWVLGCAFVVAVGVVLEGPEVFHELWPRWFTCFRRGSTSRLRKFKRTIKQTGLLAWALVAIGVAGEGIFEAVQNRAEGQLQTFDEILLIDAQRNAESARESADDAADAARRADSEAGKATESSAEAMTLARGARREADSSERDLALARQQVSEISGTLEAERAQRIELEKSLAPRLIMYREYMDGSTNVDDLRKLGPIEVRIEYVRDAECERAASNLAWLFQKAGWSVTSFAPSTAALMNGVTILGYGVIFGQNTNEAVRDSEAKSLEHSVHIRRTVEAWLELNNWANVGNNEGDPFSLGPDQLVVQVGFKPNPFFDDPAIKQVRATEEHWSTDRLALAPNANPNKPFHLEELDIPGANFLMLVPRQSQ